MSKELVNLDFQAMIGGPLTAAINAQTEAALATVDFINSVGKKGPTKDEDGELVYTDANSPSTVVFEYGDGENKTTITVPTLTIVPIPNITINSIEIDFNAKITSIEKEERKTDSKFGISASVSAKFGAVSAKLNASYSKQSQSKRSGERKKEYSLHVNVKAGQDDPPPGIDILVSNLETLATQLNTEQESNT